MDIELQLNEHVLVFAPHNIVTPIHGDTGVHLKERLAASRPGRKEKGRLREMEEDDEVPRKRSENSPEAFQELAGSVPTNSLEEFVDEISRRSTVASPFPLIRPCLIDW